jgi:hypothetical protein
VSEFLEVVKRKTRTPATAVAKAIVPLRPMYFMSTVEGAGHADGGGDGVVAVLDGGRDVASAEILGQEGVEEGVAHSDKGPNEPEEDSSHGEVAASE